jgi:hypothetical protein
MSATSKRYLAQAGRSDLAKLASYSNVKRVIITGPGAAGKSALAVRLGEITRLPVIELDKLFWRPGLTATPRDQWAAVQRELAAHESWIMDGDLGPYDVLDVRLQAADTIVFLDFSSARCACGPSAGRGSALTSGGGCLPIAGGAVRCSCGRSPPTPVTPRSTSSGPRERSADSSRG